MLVICWQNRNSIYNTFAKNIFIDQNTDMLFFPGHKHLLMEFIDQMYILHKHTLLPKEQVFE